MKRIIFIIMFLSLLTGCTSNTDKTEEYKGEELRIGVIGDAPEVRENQIKFEEIDFGILRSNEFNSMYDAIFITKDNFREASNAEYVPIYKNSKIPFCFLDNKKAYVNFINEDLQYEDEPNWKEGTYIDGMLYIKDRYWGYGLYNDIRSEANIKGVYSRVFKDISKIKNNELP